VTQTASTLIHLSYEGPRGRVRATIDRVGASLNDAAVGELAIVPQWAPGSHRPFSAGVTLAPWPNRIRDGKWEWQGTSYQLALSEPDRQTALHGLVTDAVWDVSSVSDSEVALETTINPAEGYPFTLSVVVTYTLGENGLRCEIELENRGGTDAPVALGAHPFVCVGDAPVRSLTLSSPLSTRVLVDERLLPIGHESVEGSRWDFRNGKGLKDVEFDTAFRLGGEAPFVTRLAAENGDAVELWQGSECGWIQFFLTDSFPSPTGPVSALAVEPMTAPADAFNSGEGLKVLAPGERWGTTWGIRRV